MTTNQTATGFDAKNASKAVEQALFAAKPSKGGWRGVQISVPKGHEARIIQKAGGMTRLVFHAVGDPLGRGVMVTGKDDLRAHAEAILKALDDPEVVEKVTRMEAIVAEMQGTPGYAIASGKGIQV